MARTSPGNGLEPRELTVHGHRVSYRTAGSGPVLLLLHGVTDSSQTWAPVTPSLARHFTLVAPDLLGHGDSATPRGDYSLGAHANGVRDLLTALGHQRVTVVGHSLGGGIAMQFAYQFPERCERLVLVSSGGLGREVHMLLRAAALPGADYVLPLLSSRHVVRVGRGVGAVLGRVRLRPSGDIDALARSPRRPSACAMLPTPRRPATQSQGRTTSAPGSAAARSNGCSSRPRPPLDTRTRRSQRSGNW